MRPFAQWWHFALFIYTFLFAGLGLLLYSATEASEGLGSRGWPTAAGEVISSRAVVMEYAESGSTYAVEVRYIYRVDGLEYRGDRIKQSDLTSSDPAAVQARLARYPVGQQVQVYYYPTNPKNSLLEPGFAVDLWIPIIIGLVLTVLGGLMALWLLRFIHPGRFDGGFRSIFTRRSE